MKSFNYDYIEKNILPLVERPSRYTGIEFKKYLKQENNSQVKICLIFPDLYEIGMSYLGIKLLFHYLNRFDDIFVDVAFMPKDDYAEALKKNGFTLHSLAYHKPLKDFDLLGFSLNYELCYTNILAILEYAGIDVDTAKRSPQDPLVLAGGCCTTSPKPLEKFIDAFVVGEGEEVLVEICQSLQNEKGGSLQAFSQISGVYVPSLYHGETVRPRYIKNLDDNFYPTDIVTPYVGVVHSHNAIEVQRGCYRSCKFCNASFINRPVRMRSAKEIQRLISETTVKSGATDISLLSLSVIDHPEIEDILKWFVDHYSDKNCSISLPSLRCDKFSIELADLVNRNKKSSLTFAPEAGSQRMRDIIGKNVSEEDIFAAVRGAVDSGWKLVKLYFMYGLPGETMEDIEAIVKLMRSLKQEFKKMCFNVGISSFVPKPHTPFAWARQEGFESLMLKKNYIIQSLRKIAQVKHSNIESSLVEGLLCRGGDVAGLVIESAYKRGAKFDQWKETFNYEIWLEAAKDVGIDLEKYVTREMAGEKFWNMIDCGIQDELLQRMADKVVPYQGRKVKDDSSSKLEKTKPEERKYCMSEEKFRYRIKYRKDYSIRFMSHLEMLELLKKSFVRSQLPLVFSKGFNPLPKISCASPLSVGFVGEEEFVDLELYKDLENKVVQDILNKHMYADIKIIGVRQVDLKALSLEKSLRIMEYEIVLDRECPSYEEFLNAEVFIRDNLFRKSVQSVNLKKIVYSLEVQKNILKIILNTNERFVSLWPAVREIFGISENEFKKALITRKKFWLGNGFGPLVEV
ncbi:MAG: TIGR03960 family B12-binding radical SAM protein [bacterium]|nr:TIGR03960 family B12-binding radical SAM protein [bacterium]